MNLAFPIRLISQDQDFRHYFLASMFKTYGSASNHPPQIDLSDQHSLEEFVQMVSKISLKQLSNWKLEIQGFQFYFIFEIDKDQPSNESITLILQINDGINEQTINVLKSQNLETLNFLVVIDKISKNTKQKMTKKYKNQVIETLRTADLTIQQDCIIEICVKDNINITEGPFIQKLVEMARLKNIQSSMEGSVLLMDVLNESSEEENEEKDAKTNAEKALKILIQKFTVKNSEECLKQLLADDFNNAVTMVKRIERETFKSAIQECRYYQIFLHPEIAEKQRLEKIKEKALVSLDKIADKYQIRDKQDCINEIFAHNFQQAAINVRKKLRRNQFIKQIQECRELSEYFKSIQPVIPIDPNIQMKVNAQKAALYLLETYDVTDALEYIQDLIQGKLDKILPQILRSRRLSFSKDFQDCEILQKYIKFINTSQDKNFRQSAEKALEIILKKYNAKQVKACIEDILKDDWEDVNLRIKRADKQSLKRDVQDCSQVKQYFNSLQKEDPEQTYKKSAQAEMIELLEKFGIADIDVYLPDLMTKKIDNILQELPKRKRQIFAKEYAACQQINIYLQYIKKDNRQDKEALKKKAIDRLSIIASRYGVRDIDQCLTDILDDNIEDSAYQVSKLKKQQFIKQIKSCKELEDYRKAEVAQQQIPKQEKITNVDFRQNAINALRILFSKYQIKKPELCLEQLMLNNIEDSVFFVKKVEEKDKFRRQILQCKQYQLFLNPQYNKNQQPSILLNKIKQQVVFALEEIIEKYKIQQDKDQVISDILSEKLENVSIWVKRPIKSAFLKELQECKELIIYRKFLEPVDQKGQLRKKAEKSLKVILNSFQITQQQCILQILNNNLTEALSYVIPRKISQFQQCIIACQALQKYLEYCQPKEINYKQKAKQSLIKICQQFKVAQTQQCVRQIIEGRFEDAIINVRKAYREQFEKKVKECEEYNQFLNSNKPPSSQDLLKIAEIALTSILKRFKVIQIDQCLKQIFQGDFQNVQINVRKIDRQAFLIQIQNCSQYQQYKNSIKPIDQNQYLKKQAEIQLKQILLKYVVQVQLCLDLIVNNDVQKVLKQVRRQRRSLFTKQIDQCESFNRYKEFVRKNNNQIQSNIRSILTKNGVNPSSQDLIIKDITDGNFISLKQAVKSPQYYLILNEITENNVFLTYFKDNEEKFIGNISYIYYLSNSIPQLEEIFNSIISQNNQLAPTDNKNKWLQLFYTNQKQNKIEIIEKELTEVKEIFQTMKNQKSEHLGLLLQQALKIIMIYEIKESSACLNQLLKSCKTNITDASNKMKDIQKSLLTVKDKILKQEYERQFKKYKRIIQIHNFEKTLLIKLNVKDLSQLAINFTNQLIKVKKSWNQASLILQNQKEKIVRLLTSNNILEYIKQKEQELRFNLYSIFYSLNEDIIHSLMVPIIFQDQATKILLQNQIKTDYIYQCIAKQLKRQVNQIIIQLFYKDDVLLILNDGQIVKKPEKISVFKNLSASLLFREKILKVKISKRLSKESLITVIINKFKEQKILLEKQNINVLAIFGDLSNTVEIDDSIQNLEIKNNGSLKFLKAKQKMLVTVYYQVQSFQQMLQSDKTIDDVQKMVFEKTKIPIKSQSLRYAFGDKQQEVFSQTLLEQIDPNQKSLTFTLISKMNLQHYGFHDNYRLTFEDYSQFFIQKDSDIQNMIDSCNLKKDEEKNFFDQLIRLLYSAIKRRFSFTHITKQVKEEMFNKNSQQIWSGGNFNENFLIYYILYNADQNLRIQLMNILRNRVPLPLYLKTFNNINDIREEWNINYEILWILHPGLSLTSIGLHTSNVQKEKGKTYLNNLLLFSSFQQSESKHPISHGCPQILLKALGSNVPINIIDVPSSTPTQFVNKILQITHVLIIHSWKGKKQSENYINQIKQKYKIKHVICLLRDNKTKQQTNAKVTKAKFEESPFVQLHNLQQHIINRTQMSFLNILKDKIWSICNKVNFKDQRLYPKIFKMFNSKLFEDFERLLLKLKDKFYDIKVVFNKYQQIKDLKKQKKNSPNSLQQYQKIKQQTVKSSIAPEFQQILLYIDRNNKFSQILMLRFRQILRELKNQQQKKFTIITKYKTQISAFPKEKKEQFQKFVEQAIRQIEALPKMKTVAHKATILQMKQQLATIFDHFQNEIKSMFFTIQLAWRQLQYLATLGPEVKLGNGLLLDFIIDTKRKEIANSQPFEVLDGDLLEMPKNIVQKVFDGKTDRVVVISIMGPQSSGKSTLLNFLFGCDFGTSEGRCTKGVYGTYFKFSNIKLPNCDGVFLMDTEGLFATVSAKDAIRRKGFDAKLVLFCLAVSDFVIINTKGNLDDGSAKIIKSSFDRFAALAEENIEWPQIFLVLNQNVSEQTKTSEADINKLRQIFSTQKSFSLTQAYNLKSHNKKDIAMLPENQNLVKKQPRPQFLTQTNKLQQALMSKIESKTNIQTIGVVIDLMEKVWSTIQAFPDLGKSISKKLQDIQNKIKEWRIQKMQVLSNKKDEIFKRFKQNSINEKKCQQQFGQCIKQLDKKFKEDFLNQKQIEAMQSQEKIKVQLEEKKIQLAFEAFKYELHSQIKDTEKDRLAQRCKTEGSEHQKEAIRKVKQLQRDQKRELSNEEKEKYFNEAFKKSLQKIELISAPKQQLLNYFQRVFEFYSNAANVTSANNAGLPKPEWKYEISMNYSQFSDKIKNTIFRQMGDQSNRYIQFRKNPPTKVLDGSSKTDAKLEYFNMRDYFVKKKVGIYYQISAFHLKECLKFDLLKHQMSEMFEKKSKFDEAILSIFEKINKTLRVYGFELDNFQNFKKCFEFNLKFIQWPYEEPILKIKVLQQFQTILCKKNNKNNKNNKSSYYGYINTVPAQSYSYSYESSYGSGHHSGNSRNTYNYQVSTNINSSERDSNDSNDSANESQQNRFNIIGQRQLNQIKEFLNVEILQEKIKKINNNANNYSTSYFLAKCLKEIINWSNIKSIIQKSQQYVNIKKNINQEIHYILNNDLKNFGLSISCSDYYQYICHKKSGVVMEFKNEDQVKPFEKQNDFFLSLKKFDKFDEFKIRGHLKKNFNKYPSQSLLNIGLYYEQNFEVQPEYRNTKQLQTYISNETNVVYYNLQSFSMKKFVYNELMNSKKAFVTLFNNIDKTINKSPDYLTLSTVTSIYIDVNKEIIEFNNDLNQVSHKLTLLFTGYVHLYSIYLTWKKFSEAALKQANKPYFAMLETRTDKLNFFINETSNNDNTKSEGQSDRLLNQVLAHFKELITEHKQKVNKNEAQKFKQEYPRKTIQQKIDLQCFSVTSKPDDWMEYLLQPAKVIEQKYESLTKNSIKSLSNQYQKCQKVTELLKEFKEMVRLLLEKMTSTKLTQDTLHTQLFSIHKKTLKDITVTDNQVLEVINGLVMSYFLDLLVRDEKKVYKENDFNLEINSDYEDIKIIREPTPCLQALIGKLIGHKMSITRLYIFVDMLNRKLQQKEVVDGVEVQKFSNKIKKLMMATTEDETKFRSLVTVKICKEVCPACKRICGVDQVHTNKHECRYGHQMRAIGGVKLSNNDASVIRCEDVHLMSPIKFNGRDMTWKQFKEQWEKRTEGSWVFEDLKKDPNRQLFRKAWDLAGVAICDKYGMNFKKSQEVDLQKQITLVAPTHYIFALDDSGSMGGGKWDNLMAAFKTAINVIRGMPSAQQNIKISILIQGSNCLQFQENATPSTVNLNIQPRYGGNNFADTFGKAYSLMTKYVASAKIRYVFMTDGGCGYPSAQVTQIKALGVSYPKKIQYNGIEFQTSGDTMKLISKELGGTNSISYNEAQLTAAYVEIINSK